VLLLSGREEGLLKNRDGCWEKRWSRCRGGKRKRRKGTLKRKRSLFLAGGIYKQGKKERDGRARGCRDGKKRVLLRGRNKKARPFYLLLSKIEILKKEVMKKGRDGKTPSQRAAMREKGSLPLFKSQRKITLASKRKNPLPEVQRLQRGIIKGESRRRRGLLKLAVEGRESFLEVGRLV